MPEEPKDQRSQEGGEETTQLPALVQTEEDRRLAQYLYSDATLELIGFFDAGYKRRKPTVEQPSKKVALSDGRSFEFVPTLKYGYPNTEDLDFKRGFERIAAKQLQRRTDYTDDGQPIRRPHLQPPVRFSTRELLRESGRQESGRDWKAAHNWIRRSVSTTIEGEIRYGKEGSRITHGLTHYFRKAYLTGDTLPDGTISDEIEVWPEDWYLSHIATFQTQLLDTTLHRELGRFSYAKALLPVLTAGWFASKGAPFRKSYRALCELLGLTFYKKPSDRHRQLDPNHRRLQQLAVLKAWKWDHRDTDSILTFHAGPKFHEDQEARSGRRTLASQINDRTGSPRINAISSTQPNPSTKTQRVSRPRSQRTGNPFNLTADQIAEAESMAVGVVEKIGHEKNRRYFFKLAAEAITGHYTATFWKVLAEVALAHHDGRINQSPSAYFAAALKNQSSQLDLIPSPATPPPSTEVGESLPDAASIRAQIQASLNQIAPPVILARADDLTPPVLIQDIAPNPTAPKNSDPTPGMNRESEIRENPAAALNHTSDDT